MQSWQRAILSLLLILGAIASLPGVVYLVALARVHDRPAPANPTEYSAESMTAAWLRCREKRPVAVQPTNPWGVAGRFLLGDPRNAAAGERAAWHIASSHNIAHRAGGNLWWHTSGAALGIWVTRHWSAEQIGATLVRDSLCK